MNIQELIVLTLQASVMVNVFALGLEATPADALYVLRRPSQLARSLLSMYVLMPLLALAVGHWLAMPLELHVALVVLSISPVPPLLPRKQDKAGGHSAYGLGLMVCMAVLSLVLIPLWLALLNAAEHEHYQADLGKLALLLGQMIFLPLALGALMRQVAPALARRIAGPATLLAGWLLPLAGLVVVYAAREVLAQLLTPVTLSALVLFIVAGLAIGHLLGGPLREHRIVLAMSSASRHPGVAMALATANFPGNRQVVAVIMLYLLLGVLISLLYMKWQQAKERAEDSAKAAPAGPA